MGPEPTAICGPGSGVRNHAAERLSIVIATLGRPAALKGLLGSLSGQAGLERFEVVVVDESGGDGSATICGSTPRVRLIRSERHGLSANRNLGASQACGAWLLFADDDCWFPSNWAATIEHTLNVTSADVVGGLLVDGFGQPLIARGTLGAIDLDVLQLWSCGGGAIYVRRAAFEALGGFDERLGAGAWWGAGEETDLLLRAIEKGLRCRFEPAIVVHHPAPPTGLAASARRMLVYGRGQGAVLRLHLQGPLAAKLAPMARRILLHPLWRLLHERPGLHNWSEALSSLLGLSQGFVTFRGSPWPASSEPGRGHTQSALGMLRALALLSRTKGRIS
jgi:GT2 family glycosyltransferase